jgi:hypothetical protein
VSSGAGASLDARTLWKKIAKSGLARRQDAYRKPDAVDDHFPFELPVTLSVSGSLKDKKADTSFWAGLVKEEYDITETARTMVDDVYATEVTDALVKDMKPVRVEDLVFDLEVRLEGSTFLVKGIECGGSFVFRSRGADNLRDYDLFQDLQQQAAEVFDEHLSDTDFREYVESEIERYGELRESVRASIVRIDLVKAAPFETEVDLKVDLYINGTDDPADYSYRFKAALENGLVLDVNPALRKMFDEHKAAYLLPAIIKNLDLREVSDPKVIRYFTSLLRREGGTAADVEYFLEGVEEGEAFEAVPYFEQSAQYRLNPASSSDKEEIAQFFFGRLFGE